MGEFQTVRAKQVQQQQATISPAGSGTGSLEAAIENGLKAMLGLSGVTKRGATATTVTPAFRVVYTSRLPIHQRVAGCMKNFSEAYGPVITALLLGSIAVTAIACGVGLALLVRMFMKRRQNEGYGRVELKDDVVFDAERDLTRA